RGLTVYESSPASLTAALQFGEGWRENLNKLLQGLAERGDALLFLRDAHGAAGAGKQGDDESDLADALVGKLRGDRLCWLAEARADLWRALAGADATFAECFASVALPELTVEATRPILDAAALELMGERIPTQGGALIEPRQTALEATL